MKLGQCIRAAYYLVRFGRGSRVLLPLIIATPVFAFALGMPSGVRAFTQSGVGVVVLNGVPMGHEWITRLAALELLGGDPVVKPDPADPRKSWTTGKAKNTNISGKRTQIEVARITGKESTYNDRRYKAHYKVVYDAIVGERWVDIGGFNVAKGNLPGNIDCWSAVAQEPVDVQYDHFMRRYDDVGGIGGVNAAARSVDRFIEYFVRAAVAPEIDIKVWDGGGYSAKTTVNYNYFLFGRAVHLFQDSFSPEHTVRIAKDNYERIRQVKSYLCAPGSEQHTHSNSDTLKYKSGDVIWRPGTGLDPTWGAYKPSNMKAFALVATEATKDLWAAFIRTMATPASKRAAKARKEAEQLATNWLSFDQEEMRTWYSNPAHRDGTYVLAKGDKGPGKSVSDCMAGLGVKSGSQLERVRVLEREQRMCLFNITETDTKARHIDPALHMPFDWKWKSSIRWRSPPENWVIPKRAPALKAQ